MSNLKFEYNQLNPIDYLFLNCSNLKKIKISGNLKKEEAYNNFGGHIFKGIPENGEIIIKKDVICNIPLDEFLSPDWSRNKE